MRYYIKRIEKIKNGQRIFEQCSLLIDNLEAFRKSIKADEVHFVYEIVD